LLAFIGVNRASFLSAARTAAALARAEGVLELQLRSLC
jgi:hypothetical protein